MNVKPCFKLSLIASALLTLTACGGGGDADTNAQAPTQTAPDANTGSDTGTKSNLSKNLAGAVSLIKTTSGVQARSLKSGKVITKSAVSTNSGTNLLVVNEQGQVLPAFDTEAKLEVVDTLVTPDAEYLYAAVDINNSDFSVIKELGCAIFKVKLAEQTQECVTQGDYVPNHYTNALQLDNKGNLFAVVNSFTIEEHHLDYDYNGSAQLVRYDGEGNKRVLSSDLEFLSHYKVMNDAISLIRYDELDYITDIDAATPITHTLTGQYSFTSVTQDDNNTLIYTDWGNGQNSLNFVQPGKVTGQIEKRKLTLNFDYSSWLDRVIVADDGNVYAYGFNWDGESNTKLNLYQMLPYKRESLLSMNLGENEDIYQMADKVQIARGFAYILSQESHKNYASRDVFKVVELASGESKSLLGGDWTSQRYNIGYWKLTGTELHFTGFDNLQSKMVTGIVDTLLLASGADESEYLTLNETDSSFTDALAISEMEVIRAEQSNYSDAAPVVTGTFTNKAELGSASLRFSQPMDYDSVEQNVKVTNQGEDTDVNTMFMWLGTTAHMLFDTSAADAEATQPLAFDTLYQLSIDPTKVKDVAGTSLQHTMGNELVVSQWTTMPEKGVYLNEVDTTEGVNEGKALFIRDASAEFALPSGKSLNTQVEFSVPLNNQSTSLNFEVEYGNSYRKDGSGNAWVSFTDGLRYLNDAGQEHVFMKQWRDNQYKLVELSYEDGQLELDDNGELVELNVYQDYVPQHYLIDGKPFNYIYGSSNSTGYVSQEDASIVYHYYDWAVKGTDGHYYYYSGASYYRLGTNIPVPANVSFIYGSETSVYKDKDGNFVPLSPEYVAGYWKGLEGKKLEVLYAKDENNFDERYYLIWRDTNADKLVDIGHLTLGTSNTALSDSGLVAEVISGKHLEYLHPGNGTIFSLALYPGNTYVSYLDEEGYQYTNFNDITQLPVGKDNLLKYVVSSEYSDTDGTITFALEVSDDKASLYSRSWQLPLDNVNPTLSGSFLLNGEYGNDAVVDNLKLIDNDKAEVLFEESFEQMPSDSQMQIKLH